VVHDGQEHFINAFRQFLIKAADHPEAEAAVKELQRGGFDMKKLSVVGKDYHTDEQVVGYYNAGDRMKYWGKMGAFWGGFWGLLFGAAFFWVPGVGPFAHRRTAD
jgi:hypothetical protein